MNLKTQKLKGMLCGAILIGVTSACGQNQQEQERRTPLDLVNFKELPDPTADTLSDWSKVENGLHASFVTIDKRFPKSIAPDFAVEKQASVTGWRGERVSAQILLWTNAEIAGAQVDVSGFRAESGSDLPSDIASTHFVRYVMTDEYAGGCGHRKPEDFASSLSPDMLDNLNSFDLEAKKVRPVWVTLRIPEDAKPGYYTAKVQVKAAEVPTQELNLSLHVIDKLLPKPSEWTYHLDQWQHPSAVARVEGLEMWSEEHFKALKPQMQMLADVGQKVITATLNKDPWNVQTFDPYADMIIWTKQKDGSWKYDYSVFDKWVQFMLDLGVNKMINCYSIIPWNNEIHYNDETSGELVNVEAKPGTPIFEQLWTPFLEDFVEHLRGKGWLEKTNIAIDERTREEVDGALTLLQKVSPELGVSYADNQRTYRRYPNSDDVSIAMGHPFSEEDLKDRQSRGLNTTFYIYCGNAFPNQFTFSDPAESVLVAWFAEAANFDGMLRWAFNSWVENPLLDSRFRTWPAGDTYIVYPNARSSIRYERLLEGLQDYAKIQVVKRALENKGDQANLDRLETAIQKLKITKPNQTWNQDLNDAKGLLNELSVQLVQ
ncbi:MULTISPECIES: DUF4091 domain-containing protein [Olivibacter]|jgi:hypothetical protein|uniref:Glycoside hydrolase domain-containing protein n=3 Tax=Olivibacter TaxID=376469 RepID=A0ABV6HQE0_9SPHI|nr:MULTISPECIES: DUF4091 domain-containing protein [Olivibacter]MCL4640366.1 DUF4091 domain-containing protein [Olivibacter sp. UJ_SKK_5.1]MDX3917161.1 DUF6067 family protein [Pseudosphingobacterium sp.]